MEKYGVSNEELKAELQARYAALIEREKGLDKNASAVSEVEAEKNAIKKRIEALEANA